MTENTNNNITLTESLIKRRIKIVSFLSFLMGFGFSTWSALFNNYSVEVLSLNSIEIGMIQSIREIPGFLGFTLIFILAYIHESKFIGIVVAMAGIGFFLTGFSDVSFTLLLNPVYNLFPSVSPFSINITIFTLIMSIGFHYYEATYTTLIMHTVDRDKSAKVFGHIGSFGSLGAVIGLAFTWAARTVGFDFKVIYLTVGIFVFIGGILALFLTKKVSRSNNGSKRIELKRKFVRYYLLTFLSGSRRQIFVVFAIFLLVSIHDVKVETIAILMLINQVISIYIKKEAGKLIERFGEQLIMKLDYFALTILFTGYAFVTNVNFLLVFYIIDGILFSFSISIKSYMHKISTDNEIRTNVTLGMTINHIAAVVLPFVSGVIWLQFGHSIVFLIGVVIAILSFIISLGVERSITRYKV